jgi:hypothetical protein
MIYLTPGLPVRIENADRLVYLPDGSQHVLDAHDRPLFTAPPKTGVCIVMEYSAVEEPKGSQVASFAKREHAERAEQTRREEVAADQTQQFPQVQQGPSPDMVNVNPSTGHVAPVHPIVPVQVSPLQQRPQSPFPPVAQFGPRPQGMQPGGVKVHPAAEVPSDVTGEMVTPDFREAPTGAIPEQEEPSSPQSPEHEETRRTRGHGRAAG